ncbi:VCBS repeat-containing protein [Ectothiorhodospiraceae bacterium WFHF3C12]|nr:VCBS repeat-containing protein [Ectothiorhodospiraceae bacterium WFHF3C12]
MIIKRKRILWAMLASLALTACGGGGGGGGDTDTSGGGGGADCTSGDEIECALNDLGVDTTATARQVRIDEDTTEALPEDYAPLGSASTINKFDEIQLLGLTLDDGTFTAPVNEHALVEAVPGNNNTFSTDLLFTPTAAETPWTGNDYARAGTAADVDDDGREEILVVYRDTSRTDTSVYLVVVDDAADGNTIGSPILISNALADDFDIQAGDFDGDGDMEAAVGMMVGSDAVLIFLDNDAGSLGVSSANAIAYSPQVYGSVIIALETGNLDFDRAHELAVVLNEYQTNFSFNNNDGVSRYAVYDDANAGFAQLAGGNVSVDLPGGTVSAKGADVALGDVDGDSVDEVVLGGLTAIGNECGLNADYVLTVLDDNARGLATLRAHSQDYQQVNGACESGANRHLTFMHVNAADVDGDGAKEIQANELIFQDLREDAGSTGLAVAHEIPKEDLFWPASSSSSGVFSWNSSSMAVGDVTSDEREDIVYYSQSEGGFPSGVRIWGLDQIDGWSQIHSIPVEFNNSINSQIRPQVIPANVNDDSLALKYSDGSYRLLFTEPVLIAALAAAPCSADFGQNTGDCRTAFGRGTSSSVSTENAWSLSVGSSVGYEAEFSAFGVKVGGAEAVLSVQNEYRKFTQNTYTLTKRVVHTTGPIEDSVIFTTVPLDVYTYTILSHPNPELVGGDIQVRLPREPISVMVDRDFYNAHVDEDAFQVDSSVFNHSEGAPFSYPGVAERNSLLSRYDGLMSDEVDVGQGTGFVTAEVNVFEEVTSGETYSVSATLDLRATAGGVITGVSIGGGVDTTIAYGRGQESIYQGSVAQLPSENFPDDAYRFGLFSYVYDDSGSGQTFEVVNYWVRPQL